MAVNKVIYCGETLIDISDASVTPETLLSGVTAYNAAGEKIDGTAAEGSSGGGSGGGVLTGEFCFDENTLSTTIDIGETYTNFAIFAYDKITTSTGKGTFLCAVDKARTRLYCVATNNSGSAIQTALYSESPTTATDESMTWTSTTLSVVAYEQSIAITGGTSGTALGYFLAGVTYRWYAWTEGASGGVELPELTNPAAAEQVVEGYDAINADGEVVIGTNPYEKTTTDAEVTTQASLIEQIRAVLQEKAAGSGGDDGTLKAIIERTVITPTLPSDLEIIGDYAFYSCSTLVLTSLPDGVTKIGNSAFQGCRALALSELPSGVTSIGSNSFRSCVKLALTELSSGLTSIGSYAFYECPLLALTSLPESVTSIAAYAFSGCSVLALTKLPSGITKVNGGAFANCKKLALTELPDGITTIDTNAFQNCSALALTKLPEALTTINAYGFQYCSALAISEIPSSVTTLGLGAFRYCTSLTSITFKGTPTSIKSDVFTGCANLLTINVPWSEGAVANAPWGATNATINYDYTGE